MKPKKDIIKIILNFLFIVVVTIEFGITIGYYMITKINYNKFEQRYNIEIAK